MLSAEIMAGEPMRGREAISGHAFALTDGRIVRLSAVEAPGDTGPAAVLAEAARKRLHGLVRGKAVRLRAGARATDRYGRLLAQVHRVKDDLWLQSKLVSEGRVWVRSYVDGRAMVGELLRLEAAARTARRGVWAPEHHLVLSADRAWDALDGFRIIEGEVRGTAKVRDRIYLNFGTDWREDFTISIARRDWRHFRKIGLDPLALRGHRVRVRGWVGLQNGPMIRLTHPEPLQLLP